jgi:UDP-N-acetylglucosamine 2-epimerase (non-hydrolysing)
MKLLAVVGTRPEAIKMAPVILEARRLGSDVEVCATAQHRGMLDQVLRVFGITPERDLDLMRHDQTLADLSARALVGLDAVLAESRPDWVLVQGDTTTAMIAALAAFYRRIPVGHVEAGLRTHDLDRPFPEELNRVIADAVSRARFVPTEGSRENLLREGIADDTIYVTGNTVVDALQSVLANDDRTAPIPGVPALQAGERLVLVTAHRRESFGDGMQSIARAIARIAALHPDVRIVYPVHPNPSVRAVMGQVLEGLERVHLIEPLDYLPFVRTMSRAHVILSDSGGVQEEAPSLGVPALVLRETTERPEAVAAGAVRLVGVDEEAIVASADLLLRDPGEHARMARAMNPYGDGRASQRILAILRGEPWEPYRPAGIKPSE